MNGGVLLILLQVMPAKNCYVAASAYQTKVQGLFFLPRRLFDINSAFFRHAVWL